MKMKVRKRNSLFYWYDYQLALLGQCNDVHVYRRSFVFGFLLFRTNRFTHVLIKTMPSSAELCWHVGAFISLNSTYITCKFARTLLRDACKHLNKIGSRIGVALITNKTQNILLHNRHIGLLHSTNMNAPIRAYCKMRIVYFYRKVIETVKVTC